MRGRKRYLLKPITLQTQNVLTYFSRKTLTSKRYWKPAVLIARIKEKILSYARLSGVGRQTYSSATAKSKLPRLTPRVYGSSSRRICRYTLCFNLIEKIAILTMKF